jgi:hypothetical protein
LYSCKEKEKQYTPSASIVEDSLVLNDIHVEKGINFYPNDSDLVLSYISSSRDKILLYSTRQKKIIDSLYFDKRDLGDQYYVDQHKNTFVFKKYQSAILVRDSSGNEKYIYAEPELMYISNDTITMRYSPISVPLQVTNGSLVLNNIRGYHLTDERERSLYYKAKNLAYFKIENDSLVKKTEFGEFPKFYHNNYIDEMWPVTARVGPDNVYYIFSNDNVLFDLHIPTGTLTPRKVKGLDRNKTEPYNMSRISDFSYSREYEIKNSSYLLLLHDYKEKESAIFQMLPIDDKKQDENLFLYVDKPVVVNVMDSAFNVYKKVYFKDHSKFFLEFSCFYNSKLYALERYTGTSRSSIKVYVYKIK